MAEPLQWLDDGTPASARFGDRYRSSAGHGLDQARGVFLSGCGLPQGWADQARWCVLETGFGLGLNFLVTWAAWRADPARPRLLHFVSCEAWPVSGEDLPRAAPPDPEIQALAAELAAQFQGLVPGVHRLSFDGGQVLLTLLIGDAQAMLRVQRPLADSVYLDGFAPRLNPQMWSEHTLRAVARCCHRGTRLATWSTAGSVRDGLTQAGFQVEKVPGVAPKRENLHAVYDPHWQPHPPHPVLAGARLPEGRRCAVIGAGLAGACVAASLARRGWQVTVLDAAAQPAAGASGVPAAICAPHTSPDDSLISRVSRAGLRTLQQTLRCSAADMQGEAWALPGVLEHAVGQSPRLAGGSAEWQAWSVHASTERCRGAGLPAGAPALWHPGGGWVLPGPLVRRLLQQPGITYLGNTRVRQLKYDGEAAIAWRLLSADDRPLAQADIVVVCAGAHTRTLVPEALPLQPARGTTSWGTRAQTPSGAPWPATAVNGHGMLIPHVTLAGEDAWICGSTFERDLDALPLTPEEVAAAHRANHDKLSALLPPLAQSLSGLFAQAGALHAWSGVRCTTPDHLPLVGPLDETMHPPGLWVCTGLGARGATLAALCAELLAAHLHHEPLPLDAKLAQALSTQRLRRPKDTPAPPAALQA
ncbi:MAG: FAD-dependent 5-carboxymethylaminomethyl-2-thiouridine(34) oxidoreductase MnmC [Comamonas sp.]